MNRGGDRAANSALPIIAICRLRCGERTQKYLARRVAEGLSKLEAIHRRKRYIAREVFGLIQPRYAQDQSNLIRYLTNRRAPDRTQPLVVRRHLAGCCQLREQPVWITHPGPVDVRPFEAGLAIEFRVEGERTTEMQSIPYDYRPGNRNFGGKS